MRFIRNIILIVAVVAVAAMASTVMDKSSVTYLAQFLVGDRNVATTSEDGLYAVDFKSIYNSLTVYNRQGDLNGIPVDKICLFGASPDTLPDVAPGERLRTPNQLFEIPIEVRDHNGFGDMTPNGTFDDGDTILFVGYGTGFWKRFDREKSNFVNGKMDYFYSHSPYSFYQHFVFGWNKAGKGLRMNATLPVPAGSAKSVDWMRYIRVEKDALLRDSYYGKNVEWESSSGKEWFWIWHPRNVTQKVSSSDLASAQLSTLKGRVDGGKEFVSVTYFPYRSVHDGSAAFENDQKPDVTLSGESDSVRMAGLSFAFSVNGRSTNRMATTLLPAGNFRIDNPGLKNSGNTFELTMLPNEVQYDRFDGYTVAYQWKPVVDSAEWLLPGKVGGVIQIPVGSSSNLQVVKFANLRPVGKLPISNGVAKDSVSANDDIRYLAYRTNVVLRPAKIEAIPAGVPGVVTDLMGGSADFKNMEYLIIAPNEFLSAALALKKFRSEGSAVRSFATQVVSVEDIYRHYTGGSLSPVSIRNFIAHAYKRSPKLKYVLLAGSGHYDYRIMDEKNGKIFIPPFEKESAVSEDFYAALDSGEQVLYGQYDLDVAVGRLPVSTLSEFTNYIEKAKQYEQVGVFDNSLWRSNILLGADDAKNGTTTDYTRHTEHQEEVAEAIDNLYHDIKYRWNLKKVYLVDYPADASGQKKEAAEDFINVLNQGALFTIYFGHGSKTDWAGEGLMKPAYISKLTNKNRYTVLSSFTCTVGRFEEGFGARSLSESMLLAKNAGSIASIGSARETFATYNVPFGKAFMVNVLSSSGILLGDAYLKTKNASSGSFSSQRFNNESYVFMGEPVIQMPKVGSKIVLDQKLDSIKGLDKMTLSGSVSGMNSGYINLSMREGRIQKRLPVGLDDDSLNVTYEGTLIYSEEIPVSGGHFKTEFITPKKINYGDSAAEFSAWAYSSRERNVGRLYKANLKISGMSSYADSIHDEVPPSIRIQPCYTEGMVGAFADGQSVKLQDPACLQIVIEDSTALDFRDQADEGISFEVVGIENPYHPYPYLEQTSKRAVLRKTFASETYPEGKYLFKVRAQDVLGNVVTKSLNLEITGEMKEGLVDVFNIPNPVGKKGTTFYFKNLAINRTSTVNIFIYNQNGRLVKVLKNAVSGLTRWDGRDNHGRLLANGLYHYVVKSDVAATDDFKKKTWTKKQKLLISR